MGRAPSAHKPAENTRLIRRRINPVGSEGSLDAVGHEMKGRAASHFLPLIVGPCAANRPKHIPSQNPRAEPVKTTPSKIAVGPRRAAILATHLLERAGGKHPLM